MAETIRVTPDDPRLSWEGAVAVEVGDGWAQPWRLSSDLIPYAAEALRERAGHSTGVRIVFVTDALAIHGTIDPIGVDPAPYGTKPIDVVTDGKFVVSVPVQERNRFSIATLPAGKKRIELWLPQIWRFRLRSLELDNASCIEAPPDTERLRWVVYGSSIEQCVEAPSPTQTWPAIVARERDLDLVCLGFGAQCHLDAVAALTIRDTPADLITLRLGINVQIASTLNQRTFRSSIMGFVRLIREKHPHTPVALISPIASPPREKVPNAVGMTVAQMREEVRHAHTDLVTLGDDRIIYVDGLDLMGFDDARLMPDNLHPGPEGYRVLARRYLNRVQPRFEEMLAT